MSSIISTCDKLKVITKPDDCYHTINNLLTKLDTKYGVKTMDIITTMKVYIDVIYNNGNNINSVKDVDNISDDDNYGNDR